MYCAASAQGSSHMCMRGKFKCLKDIGNNKGKKYVKGTWNIIIVNVNLNTVLYPPPEEKCNTVAHYLPI